MCECLPIFVWKLSLFNVAPLLYIPGLGLDSSKVYAQPKMPINKKCVWMFADIWVKIVSIQCCPLIVYPRLRPRLKERLRSTEKAHQQKICVNVCWCSGEKLTLFNAALIVYSKFRPRLNERVSSTKKPITKNFVRTFADIWVKNCLYSMLPPYCISQV